MVFRVYLVAFLIVCTAMSALAQRGGRFSGVQRPYDRETAARAGDPRVTQPAPAVAPAAAAQPTPTVSPTPAATSPAQRRPSAAMVNAPRTQTTPEPAPAVVLPPTPENMPASPPSVSYVDGLLAISASNSTLSDILAAVRARTGANIEAPPSTQNERVAARIGPGPARDVLASLLQGSHFDYILLGSMEDPQGVQRIVLTRKSRSAGTAGASAAMPMSAPAARPAVTRPRPDYAPPPEPVEDEADLNNPAEDNEPEVQAEQQPQPIQPGVPQPGVPQPGVGQPIQQPGMIVMPQIEGAVVPGQPIAPMVTTPQPETQTQPGGTTPPQTRNPRQVPTGQEVKTPEELLQELQRIQNQQQNQTGETPEPPAK